MEFKAPQFKGFLSCLPGPELVPLLQEVGGMTEAGFYERELGRKPEELEHFQTEMHTYDTLVGKGWKGK